MPADLCTASSPSGHARRATRPHQRPAHSAHRDRNRNDTDDHGAVIRSPCFWTPPAPVVHRTPNMGVNLWGASPLDENGNLKEGSIPSVTPIDKVLGEGNCGEATNRGKEACEPSTGVAAGSVHAKAARLRTETPCRPRETLRRVADGQRSRSQQAPR